MVLVVDLQAGSSTLTESGTNDVVSIIIITASPHNHLAKAKLIKAPISSIALGQLLQSHSSAVRRDHTWSNKLILCD